MNSKTLLRFVLLTTALSAAPLASAQTVAGDCADNASTSRNGLGGLIDNLRAINLWNPFRGNWCSEGSLGQAGWARDASKPTSDSTDAFRAAHTRAKAGDSPLPANANEYVYLFVGGLFTEHYAGYMNDNIERLESRGLKTRRVEGLDTDASVETNAATIRKAILDAHAATGKTVVVIGHSKGGVDAAAALSIYPELAAHVRVNIAMQAPYGGSPMATDIGGCPRLAALADHWIKNAWGGDTQALRDLSYAARRKFIGEHPYPSNIPTVSLATSRYDQARSVLFNTEWYMKYRYGLGSDGLVVREDAEIPGSRVIRLDDMDHAEGTSRGVGSFPNYKPGDVTEALIAVALGR